MEFGHLDPKEGLESARAAVGRALQDGPELADIREEFGITNPPKSGEWAWTTAISEDPRPNHQGMTSMAAE